MEKLEVVEISDLRFHIESRIANFIVETKLSKDYIDWDFYDKNVINKALRKMKKEKLKKVLAGADQLYKLIDEMELTIHKNAYNFLAFLRDLKSGEKTL